MSSKKSKNTKEDFSDFLLDDEIVTEGSENLKEKGLSDTESLGEEETRTLSSHSNPVESGPVTSSLPPLPTIITNKSVYKAKNLEEKNSKHDKSNEENNFKNFEDQVPDSAAPLIKEDHSDLNSRPSQEEGDSREGSGSDDKTFNISLSPPETKPLGHDPHISHEYASAHSENENPLGDHMNQTINMSSHKKMEDKKENLTEQVKVSNDLLEEQKKVEVPSYKDSEYFNKDKLDPSLFSLEAALKQSEHLKLAQNKIKELERKLELVTSENEELTASAVVLKKKYDEIQGKMENLKRDSKESSESKKDELVLKDKIIQSLERDIENLKRKNEEFRSVLDEKINQVRVRERELQNRLEILQLEGDVVVTNKDEIILSLKKQIDQQSFEMGNYKAQLREMNHEIQTQKDQVRKSIKAIKLAMAMLENEGLSVEALKKTGS